MKPYIPLTLPMDKINWVSFIRLIADANRQLALYEGLIKTMVNPSVLLSPLMTNEAVLSSKIEGTQATLQEVLTFEAMPDERNPKAADIKEVLNYRKAIQAAVEKIKANRPLCLHIVRELHYFLMEGVRGKDKGRGEFRKEQNWIGKPGSTIEQATFVPPEPANVMGSLYNWENYLHFEEEDRIVQLAVIHAQFELIHPFLDGNGRIGRILIPLFLYEKELLSKPVFYMSEYLESHREEYYERLKEISQSNKWNEWIGFFLTAFIEQAKRNIQKAEMIHNLYGKTKLDIHEIRTRYELPTLDALFQMPIFNSSNFIQYTGIPKPSAQRILKILKEKGIITELRKGGGRKPAIFAFTSLTSVTGL